MNICSRLPVVVLALLAVSVPAESQQARPAARGLVLGPEGAGYRTLGRLGILDSVIRGVNRRLRIPATIPIEVDTCRSANVTYETGDGGRRIRVCEGFEDAVAQYAIQYMADLRRLVSRDLTPSATAFEFGLQALSQALAYGVLHEVGHALIEMFNLPVLGRTEDAADQFAVWFSLREQRLARFPESVWGPGGAAGWLGSLGVEQGAGDAEDIGGAHALPAQRSALIYCLLSGEGIARGDSEDNPGLRMVHSATVPRGRTPDECKEEWLTTDATWRRLLGPYMRR